MKCETIKLISLVEKKKKSFSHFSFIFSFFFPLFFCLFFSFFHSFFFSFLHRLLAFASVVHRNRRRPLVASSSSRKPIWTYPTASLPFASLFFFSLFLPSLEPFLFHLSPVPRQQGPSSVSSATDWSEKDDLSEKGDHVSASSPLDFWRWFVCFSNVMREPMVEREWLLWIYELYDHRLLAVFRACSAVFKSMGIHLKRTDKFLAISSFKRFQ